MPSSNTSNLPLLIVLGFFMVFLFVSSRRRKQAAAKLAESVKVGAKAVMLGGIVGTIKEIKDDSVVIETTPGTRIEFLKAAVRSVAEPSLDVKPEAEASKKPAPAKKATTAKTSTTKSSTAKKTAK